MYSNQFFFFSRFSATGLWGSTDSMLGNGSVLSDLQWREMSEPAKGTAAGKTPGSRCYQFFKFMVMTQTSHYIYTTGCIGALFISLLLRMVSRMQVWQEWLGRSCGYWQGLCHEWIRLQCIPWCLMTGPAREHCFWAAFIGSMGSCNIPVCNAWSN